MFSEIFLTIIAVLGVVDFALFNIGFMFLILAERNQAMAGKGKNILLAAFVFLLIIILISLFFYLISLFFKEPSGEEFPPLSFLENFPPSPEFIDVGNYHFSGPVLLKNNNNIRESAVYGIFCKKNEQYSIIYISETESSGLNFLKHNKYNCWLEKCDNNLKNLYLAVLRTPDEKYDFERKEEIMSSLKQKVSPSCYDEEDKDLEL